MDASYFLPKEVSEKRTAACESCESYISVTKMCGECLCYMPWKVVLAPASCPLEKWSHETVSVIN